MHKERTMLHTLDSQTIHTAGTVALLIYVIIIVATISILRQAPLSKREKLFGAVSVKDNTVRIQPIQGKKHVSNLKVGGDIRLSVGKDAAYRKYSVVSIEDDFLVLSPYTKDYDIPSGKQVIGMVVNEEKANLLSEIFNIHNSEK